MIIQPFRIAIAPAEIAELKQRLRETRWPVPIQNSSWRLGMDAEFLQSLMDYWQHDFDWQVVESKLNDLPQYIAETAGGPIHFVHLRGSGADAVPIVLTHGWPGTFAEFATLGRMIANPSAFGATEVPSFDVVIPSLPGFPFSPAPVSFGTNSYSIANQWSELMCALGYRRYMAHGGDLGAGVSTCLGLQFPEELIGVHLNFIPGSFLPYLTSADGLTQDETAFLAERAAWLDREGAYSHLQATKPDVVGVALNDSPAGLAAWIIDKYRVWSDCDGDLSGRFTHDELLTVISLYWFTRSMPSAIRMYWEGRQRPLQFPEGQRVRIPVAVAHFPKDLPMPPRHYVERGYDICRWTEFARGGHFAALEEPLALAADIRAFARSLM